MSKKSKFLDAITERQEELYTLLSELVKIDSQNFGETGNEAAAAAFVAEKLRQTGLVPDVYSPVEVPGLTRSQDYWPGHHLENRFNVTAVKKGGSRKLMLAAHSDTVPVGDPALWSFSPFSGEIRDGRIHGRGACDDKYAIAAALYLLQLLHDTGVELPYDLLFTAYCDEEQGGGNGALAACMKYPCDDIVNLDCKNFDIWANASGGGVCSAYICADRSLDSCEAMLDGLNLLRQELKEFGARRSAELRRVPMYRDTVIPDTALRFNEIRSGDGSSDFNRAHITFTFYTASAADAIREEFAQMETNLNEALAPLGMRLEKMEMTTRFFHFMQTADENPAMETLIRAAEKSTGRTLAPCGSCLSDLSLFVKYGSPRAFSFGIGRDFFAYGGAHQTDEFVECANLLEYARILGAFLLEYAGGESGGH